MAVDLVFLPAVAEDIEQAYGWYEQRRVGLGEDFLSCIEACLSALRRMPEMHGKVYREYRRGLVRRFPYAVYYECSGDTVTVYGVFHTSRSAEGWRRRIEEPEGRPVAP